MLNRILKWLKDIISLIIFLIFILILLIPEVGQWTILAGWTLDIFEIDYSRYDHLMPYQHVEDGKNYSTLIVVGLGIVILLVLAVLLGNDDIRVILIIFEILAPLIVGYVLAWVAGIYLIMKFLGLTISKWLSLIIAIIIHLLLVLIINIVQHVRREFKLPHLLK